MARGKTMPAKTSTFRGQTFNWSRIAYVGGNQIVSGDALFTTYRPIYDHRLVWARGVARRHSVSYWPLATGVPASTYVKSITWAPAANQTLVTAGAVRATSLAGSSSKLGQTGNFIPTATLRGRLVSGSGSVPGSGPVLSEGVVLSEGLVLSESGQRGVGSANDSSLLGEP